MPKKVVQFDRIGAVTLSRNKRSKSIKISVKPNNAVLVSFPFFVQTKEAMAFVEQNEAWIKKQQQKFHSSRNSLNENSVIETRLHKIVFLIGGKNRAEVKGNTVEVTVTNFEDDKARWLIENVVTEVYRFEARKILPGRLQEIAKQHGFNYSKVTIRNNRRNWGSCSSKNNISLNLQMMKLPDNLIDYILLHELVHTEIKDHSSKFWQRMDQLTGNRAKELSKAVKMYSAYTL
ncbi:MAG: M48 family metallopeptidase [Prolixibacteraceae bacterium]